MLIEFLDELVFGVREAAWPLIRNDLALDYTQVGILLGLPGIVSNFVEPALGILGDVWRRRVLVLGGGIAFCVALALVGASQSFAVFLLASSLLYPASGAFVSLAQATLMDSDPARHEQNMARWAFAGSVGVVAGTIVLGGASGLGVNWRWLFLGMSGLAIALVVLAARFPFPKAQRDDEEVVGFTEGLVNAARALKRPEVLRWLTLLQFSDLMMDVLLGYLALYFVDVARATPQIAALGVTVWTVLGLVGDFLLIPLLERVSGLRYLRLSAAIELALFPAFLLAPEIWMKFVLIGLLGLFNSGWYAILKGRLYSSMPGQSGSVLAVGNVFGLAGSILPIALGAIATQYGLSATMWALLAGPLALLIGIPPRDDRK